ncbi:hypothetical protein BZA77DRAFT_344777 [Pyronema omphalodes]|nr:hypothetical protein BZA77DRAFT_344777 [Pyronema omphalodes]
MGMKAPSPSSPGAEEGDGEEKNKKDKTPGEDKPLVTARAGRARGPRGRKLPTVVKKEAKEKKEIVQKLEIVAPWLKKEKKEEVNEEKRRRRSLSSLKGTVRLKRKRNLKSSLKMRSKISYRNSPSKPRKRKKSGKTVSPIDSPSEIPAKEEQEEKEKKEEEDEIKEDPVPAASQDIEREEIEKGGNAGH